MVTGSRDWVERSMIRFELYAWHTRCLANPTLVHGACPTGVDALAAEVAQSLGWPIEEHPADWDKHGRSAGPIRNREMVLSGVDHVLAFHLNGSRGTAQAVRYAKQRGVPVTSWVVDNGDYSKARREEFVPDTAASSREERNA